MLGRPRRILFLLIFQNPNLPDLIITLKRIQTAVPPRKKITLLQSYLSLCTDVYPIKSGGQREVSHARHPEHGEVVVKFSQKCSTSGMERLAREVSFLKTLNSECFPKMYEFLIEPAEKCCIIVEEYIPGKELTVCKPQFQSEQKIIQLLKRLVECLSIVWNQNVVHRDLKPENILIKNNGNPAVIDFGIARFLDENSLTRTMAHMGPATPIYAAPEQLTNQKHNIGIRTDFFALGLIALELCLGKHPFSPELVGGESIISNIILGQYKGADSTNKTSEQFQALMRRLLQTQPFLRPRNHVIFQMELNKYWS